MVSAMKVDGRRLHELAREGKEVDRGAAARPDRPRSTSRRSRPASTRTATLRVECGSGHLHPVAGRRPRRAPSAAAPTSRACVRLRVGSFGLAEARPLDEIDREAPDACVVAPLAAMRDLEPLDVDDEQARAVSHGMTFPATLAAAAALGDGPVRGRRPRLRPPRRLRAPARRDEAGRGRRSPAIGIRSTADARRHGSHRLRPAAARCGGDDRRVRRRPPRPPGGAARRARARGRARPRGLLPHLRPSPGRGRAPRVRAEAAHVARAEARAARRDRLLDTTCVLTFDEARSKEPAEDFVERGARRPARRPARHRRRRLPLRLPAPRRRPAARADGRGARVPGARARARPGRGRRRRHAVLLDPDPPAARRGPAWPRRPGSTPARPGPTRCAGRSSSATGEAGSSGFPTANVEVPARVCLPADGIYAGTFVGRRRRGARRRRSRSGGARRSTRTPRRPCSRPMSSTSTATSTARPCQGPLRRAAPRRGAASRASTPSSSRWAATSRPPGGCSGLPNGRDSAATRGPVVASCPPALAAVAEGSPRTARRSRRAVPVHR